MAPVSDAEVEVEVTSVSDRGRRGRAPLSLDDCRCPVCLEIFMEPVTLPCKHTFCKSCFLETVNKATLCCPMCRKRVSTWARLNSRNNTLVNQELWKQIQTCFPLQCQRRLTGQEAEVDQAVSLRFPRVSQPGELRQEYEEQITKLTEEKRALDEEERKASEEYIHRLLAEEEQELQEDRKRREDDERLARMLSNQLNSAPVSQENLRPAGITPAKKKVGSGQIDKFLCPRPSKIDSSGCSSASGIMANKENIHFSQVECPLPNLDYCSHVTHGLEPPPGHPASVEDQTRRSQLARDGGSSSTKRKSSELEATEEEEQQVITTKRGCHSLPSSSCSLEEAELLTLQGMAEWQAELLSRRQQEEEDCRLAQLLQKELNQEEKQRATDRRKGSGDAYLLRQSKEGKVETSTTTRASRKTTKISSCTSSAPSASSLLKSTRTSSPSPSSSNRGGKQTTLTEMFSSLSS
uniref:E3 ubiquitin-protein ligase rnf168 n=1 Tax=Monopterus albus TaxID=43700 RepID=UPI0009B48D05|nr:E3 ubiquitin-protein ligase RNF168 [Monopterus albus]